MIENKILFAIAFVAAFGCRYQNEVDAEMLLEKVRALWYLLLHLLAKLVSRRRLDSPLPTARLPLWQHKFKGTCDYTRKRNRMAAKLITTTHSPQTPMFRRCRYCMFSLETRSCLVSLSCFKASLGATLCNYHMSIGTCGACSSQSKGADHRRAARDGTHLIPGRQAAKPWKQGFAMNLVLFLRCLNPVLQTIVARCSK